MYRERHSFPNHFSVAKVVHCAKMRDRCNLPLRPHKATGETVVMVTMTRQHRTNSISEHCHPLGTNAQTDIVTYTHTHTHTHTLTLTLTHSDAHTHTHTHTHNLFLSLTHTHTRTHLHVHCFRCIVWCSPCHQPLPQPIHAVLVINVPAPCSGVFL